MPQAMCCRPIALALATLVVAACDNAPLAGRSNATASIDGCAPATTAPSQQVIAVISLPGDSLVLDRQGAALPLTDGGAGANARALATALESGTGAAILQLDCVQSDRPPGAVWEVYVAPTGHARLEPQTPFFVGTVALFGDGIKSERQKPFARFAFPIDQALRASANAPAVSVIFVATSGVEARGQQAPVTIAATVRVGSVALLLERSAR